MSLARKSSSPPDPNPDGGRGAGHTWRRSPVEGMICYHPGTPGEACETVLGLTQEMSTGDGFGPALRTLAAPYQVGRKRNFWRVSPSHSFIGQTDEVDDCRSYTVAVGASNFGSNSFSAYKPRFQFIILIERYLSILKIREHIDGI